jgi:pyruvate formate lyase activating enzyme
MKSSTPKLLVPAEREQLESVEGIIFDIQRYSVHDGPGLRSNIFFKGCPLRCGWCANPESQNFKIELALSEQNCMNCGQFEMSCPDCWSNRGCSQQTIDFQKRTSICPTGAIHWIGERRTAGDVMKEVLRDIPFYADGGGMTLTGGEPTMQPDLADALLRLAKTENISTAMETCGHTHWSIIERLLPCLDDILYDLKHVDSEIHLKHTGMGNELILSNLDKLTSLGAPVTIRIPLIPGFNASVEAVNTLAQFIAGLKGAIKRIDILPYHTLGKAKYAALGYVYPWAEFSRINDDDMALLIKAFKSYGLPINFTGL